MRIFRIIAIAVNITENRVLSLLNTENMDLVCSLQQMQHQVVIFILTTDISSLL